MKIGPAEVAALPRKWMGDIKGFAHALRAGKQVFPPAVIASHEGGLALVGGRRRWAAHIANGEEQIEVWLLRNWSDLMRWVDLDDEYSDGTEKPMVLTDVVEMVDWAIRHVKPSRAVKPELTLGGRLGVTSKNIGYVRSVLRYYVTGPDVTPELREYALGKLKAVDLGEIAAHTAYEHAKRFADGLKPKATMPAPDQVHRLQTAIATLNGIATGLGEIGDISPDLTPETCREFAKALTPGKVQVERVIRALRARSGESEA